MLITFAPTPWYLHGGEVFGLTRFEDLQLGGLIMWLPGALAYVIAGLTIVGRWLGPARMRRDGA